MNATAIGIDALIVAAVMLLTIRAMLCQPDYWDQAAAAELVDDEPTAVLLVVAADEEDGDRDEEDAPAPITIGIWETTAPDGLPGNYWWAPPLWPFRRPFEPENAEQLRERALDWAMTKLDAIKAAVAAETPQTRELALVAT